MRAISPRHHHNRDCLDGQTPATFPSRRRRSKPPAKEQQLTHRARLSTKSTNVIDVKCKLNEKSCVAIEYSTYIWSDTCARYFLKLLYKTRLIIGIVKF